MNLPHHRIVDDIANIDFFLHPGLRLGLLQQVFQHRVAHCAVIAQGLQNDPVRRLSRSRIETEPPANERLLESSSDEWQVSPVLVHCWLKD
jgi:hypothetical protein